MRNLDISANLGLEDQKYDKNENFQNDILKTQDLVSDNSLTGTGSAWNVTHYANQTITDLDVSFNNNSHDDTHAKANLYGWNGYQLNSTITNLYDTRNWINGTFDAGFFSGSPSGSNDSEYIDDWTFKANDIPTHTNTMSGNYYDGSTSVSDYESSLELRINGDGSGRYDVGDKCWWETNIQLDRGDVEDAWLSFSVRAFSSDEFNNHMVLQVLVNGKILWGNGLASMLESSGNPSPTNWGQWYNPYPIYLDGNDKQLFPDGIKNMNVTLEFKRVSGTASGYYSYYTVLFDNVSLIVKSKAKPTQLGLQLNGEDVNDNTNYGEGSLGIIGNWNGSLQSSVIANFSSNSNWPFTFQDDGNWISYKVELSTNLNLYASKSTPETYYIADPSLGYQGSSFIASNNSNTNWTTYAHMEVPAGYEETNMTIDYPLDYNLTGIFFSLNPDSLSQASITEYGNKKVVNIPVSSITSNTNGFWKLTAVSPNYCEKMNIYNNNTGNWELNSQFLSGEYINITGKINNSLWVSGYLHLTKAQLQIRFPNGTIWSAKNQLKFVESTGWVYFDPIRIPDDIPNYEVGEYEAIIMWNNSYSSFGLNETGVIYQKFAVIHDSLLYPDQGIFFIDNIAEDRIVNIKVSFNDLVDNAAIDYATVYTNFTGTIETLDRISPGFYLYEFNASKANPGNNTITIYANHSFYLNKNVNITVYVIKQTILTAEEYPSLGIAWNNNFTIHLNYTYKSNGIGIENADLTIEWNGEKSSISGNGLYNITLNSSLYQINKAYNLKIKFDKTGCEEQIMIISVEIVPRETNIESILINNIDCTTNKTYNIKSGELLNFKVLYNDLESSGTFIKGALVSLNKSTEIGEVFEENPTYYNLTLNSIYLGVGTSFINIIAEKINYTSTTVILTINVYERGTEYKTYLDGIDYTSNPAISTYTNQLINLTVSYIDLITTQHISGAIVDINGSGVSEILGESYSNYTIMLDTTELNDGINFLTIYARKGGYEPQSITLAIQIVQIDTVLNLYLNGQNKTSNPAITTYTNQLINLTVSYKESVSNLFISGAIVDINGSGVSEVLGESYDNYTVLLDTTELNFGANFLTIYARKGGYEPQSIILTIQVVQIDTELNLYLNGDDKTSNPAITTYTNQLINLTVSYKESVSTLFISGATVDVNGSGVSEVLGESYDNYTVLLHTTDLNFGANFLTIYARKGGYEPQSIIITIQVVQIDTELNLYLNGDDKTLNPSITTYTNQLINLTVSYKESVSTLFISGATVDVNGSGVSEVLGESYDNYTVLLHTTDLNFGANFLTIYARKGGYEPQSIILTIQVVQIDTELTLYLNGEDKTSNPAITMYTNQLINLTVSYKESISKLFISGATVDVNGSGISEVLGESYSNYTIILDTTDLNFGANFLTIYARTGGYEPQSIIFTIQIIQIETELELYLDTNSTKYIEVIIGDFVNLTVIYKEFTGSFINNATIKIVGEGLSADTYLTKNAFYNQYEVSIDTLDLNFGINLLTLYAEKLNYEPQTVQITIEIIEKETDLHILLNGLNKTIDRTLTLPIRSLLNVTVKYLEFDSGLGISGATIQLVGEGLSLYLTENPSLQQYSISVDTTQLDIGVRFLTIYAQRANYQSYSALLRIQVDRIRTNITTFSGETVINRQPGQDYRLKIELLDLDFLTHILNATVTYTWAYGQGTLMDPENDGIYEGTLSNLRAGTFTVTISVYAGDDYEFERFTVTLNVVRPPEDVLLFQILTILGLSAALGLGGYLIAYQKVLKYPKQVRKIRKYKSKLKKPKSTGIEVRSRDQLIEDSYAEKMRPLEKQLKSKISPKTGKKIIQKETFEESESNQNNFDT